LNNFNFQSARQNLWKFIYAPNKTLLMTVLEASFGVFSTIIGLVDLGLLELFKQQFRNPLQKFKTFEQVSFKIKFNFLNLQPSVVKLKLLPYFS
jgi:hypothetical protein